MHHQGPATGWPRAALFDLDGTLVDSVPDITEAVAELLENEGLDRFSVVAVRGMVGHGVRMLVKRAYAARGVTLDESALDAKTAAMMRIYPDHLIARTTLNPGTAEALAALAGRGTPMAVVTNKPQRAAETVLDHFGLTGRFALVLGDDPASAHGTLPRKPAPDVLLHALTRFGVAPDQAVMVGDSGPDIQSANAGHIASVAVRGGYSTVPLEEFGPTLIIDTMAELPATLERHALAMS